MAMAVASGRSSGIGPPPAVTSPIDFATSVIGILFAEPALHAPGFSPVGHRATPEKVWRAIRVAHRRADFR